MAQGYSGEAASCVLFHTLSWLEGAVWVTPKTKMTPLHPGLLMAGGLGQSLRDPAPLALLCLPGDGFSCFGVEGDLDISLWDSQSKPGPHLRQSGDEQAVPATPTQVLCPLASDTLIPRSESVL